VLISAEERNLAMQNTLHICTYLRPSLNR